MNKVYRTIIALLVLFVVSGSTAFAQWNLMNQAADSVTRIGIDKIYNMKFDEAEKIAKQLRKTYPEHPVGNFLESTSYWWRILIYADSRKYDKKFLSVIDDIIEQCDDKLEDTPSDIVYLFFKGAALGYRGRYYSQRESWVKAALDGHAAYRTLEKALSVAPGNRDLLFGIGYYNYFAVVLPAKYPLLKPLMSFAPVGDKKLGLLQLKASAKSARYANLEAEIILMQIFYTFEKNTREAKEIATSLHKRFPQNPYFHKYVGRCCVILGQFDEMESVWMNILKRARAKQAGYDDRTSREAMYYYGTALYYKGAYDRALKYFLASSKMSKKFDKEITGYVIQSNLKIGKIYDKQGKRAKANEYFQKVASWQDNNGSRAEARALLKRK